MCVKKCRAEQRYMLFWYRHRALSGKFQSTGRYTNDAMIDSELFPRNALGDGPAFWIFYPEITDKG